MSIAKEIEKLRTMKVPELVKRYREVFGKKPRVKNKEWLWKRCAYQLQVVRYGGLSGAAQRRLEALIAEINLPAIENQRAVTGKLRAPRAPGIPAPGTTIVRTWRGREYHVKVLEEGFEYDDAVFKSLSAVARQITSTRWNGPLFFNLRKRGKK